jgi:acyl-CoA thioester hydrolase
MKHELKQRVYYADTDAYGVVWHGTYLRWMEQGRVELCDGLGLDLVELKKQDIAIPVTNMNVRYKASAKLDDRIIIETWISKLSPITVTFGQTIRNAETNCVYIQAEFETVAINNNGKLYRRMPQSLKEAFERALECKD